MGLAKIIESRAPAALAGKAPVTLDCIAVPNHGAGEIDAIGEALQHAPPVMVQINLPTLDHLSSRQGAQMIAGGVGIAGSALATWAARSRDFWRVDGVEPIRSPLTMAADGVPVTMEGVRARE